MKFQFEGNLVYQERAIHSVANLFVEQPYAGPDFSEGFSWGQTDKEQQSTVANRLLIPPAKVLDNLWQVQLNNDLPQDEELYYITETVALASGKQELSFPNFSVEMETGTGKTYVYIRTALELNRRYGWRKFIIVVPSVAIREGVMKTLEVTKEHLRAIYDNLPYRYSVYDSKNLAKLWNFCVTTELEFMVMTVDSFNKEDNVIRQSRDKFQGRIPLHALQATRPILILDEPQNLESEGRIKALAALNPLLALRYSATHRNPYNVAYRLTPYQAYRQGLVKRIEVAPLLKEKDFNQVFLRLDEIRRSSKTVQAKIAVQQRMADGTIKEKGYLFKPGDSLEKKAERPEYAEFVIEEILPGEKEVRFKNGVTITEGQTQGADRAAIFREQIRYTVEQHFRRQAKLKPFGIKVLSLFFIDRVENYHAEPDPKAGANRVDGLYPGIIKQYFDEAFDHYKAKYKTQCPDLAKMKATEVRSGYFAEKSKKGSKEALDSTGKSAEDRAAFNLIMKDKEKLLSFDEPVAFLFSHSALREGWDNPNVCQICTLNQTTSEIKKRQEVGRGMRLVVNQDGERVHTGEQNELTVIVNESYEEYVEKLQAEIRDEYGEEGVPPKPVNAREKKVIKRKPLEQLPEEFKELWERIKHKTRYQVKIDTAQLVADVVADLDKLTIDPPKIVASKARVEVKSGKDELQAVLVGQQDRHVIQRQGKRPDIVSLLGELLTHVNPPIRLTRQTLAEVVCKTKHRERAWDNPQEFISHAARVLRQRAIEQLIDGIEYIKTGLWYEMQQWVEQEEANTDRIMDTDKSIYDQFVFQSEVERKFATKLDSMEAVKLFVKLPGWFKVDTPVGGYNPDWGIVMKEQDAFGDDSMLPLLYLVRETKSTLDQTKLHVTEGQKIECGKSHFIKTLKVDYKVVRNAEEIR
jgi:type III restriction enzyme